MRPHEQQRQQQQQQQWGAPARCVGPCIRTRSHSAQRVPPTRLAAPPAAPAHRARVGIAVHGSFNGSSSAALLTQGVLDSVCAGLLIYLVMGDHLNASKAHSQWLQGRGPMTAALAFGAFVAGAAGMAVIGIWA